MITIKAIPHNEQRYNTVGDWYFDEQTGKDIEIKVSDTGDDHMNQLIMIHELIEALLCQANGISATIVDAWDKEHEDHPDPGSIPKCVYYREHMVSTMIERTLAAELNVNWSEYETVVELLMDSYVIPENKNNI